MNDTWILGLYQREPSSFVAETLDDGVVRVWDEFWEHTCLDLDLKSRWATERDQSSHRSDDPLEWDIRRYPLKQEAGAWLILLEQDNLQAWIDEHRHSTDSLRELAERVSVGKASMMSIADAEAAVLESVQALRPGWNPLAPRVQALIREHATAV